MGPPMSEKTSSVVLIEPAMETLFARSKESLWPLEILDDPDLIVQAEMRQKLHAKLNTLFQQMSDPVTEVTVAVHMGEVRPRSIAELYDLLTAFLDVDPHHRRLVLYLPFELIPSKKWRPPFEKLRISSDRFVRSYMKHWRELLGETDVRANFADGNILEKELAPYGQPLVRKAAHLIPQLVKKGLVSVAEVTALMDGATSDVLKDSIANALATLTPTTAKIVCEAKKEFGRDWLKNLPKEIAFELKKLDMREALDISRNMPPARITWERRNNEDVLIGVYAERIAETIIAEQSQWKNLPPLLYDNSPTITWLAVIRGVRMAVEKLTGSDLAKARHVCVNFMLCIQKNWRDDLQIWDELETVLSYWIHLGIIAEADFLRFGFEIPKLDAEFSKTGPLVMEIAEFKGAIESIAQNPELSRLLYPAAIFFGSRLKNYAKRNADLDAAIFVRPGVPEKERAKIRHILAQLFSSKNVGGKVVEFWLEAEGEKLRVRDFPDPDVFLADSTWVHLLLSSVWLGQEEMLEELYTKLLPGFLYSAGKTFEGRDVRTLCLEEMEREVLQYRLMHKGYRRFFPPQGGIDAGAKGLDPASVFWDSGYRRLATKLFISRVFLPQLK